LSQSVRRCGILHRFGLLEVLNLLMLHISLLATCGVAVAWGASQGNLASAESRFSGPGTRCLAFVSSSATLRLLRLYRPACTPWMVATTGSTVHTPSGVSSRSPPLVSSILQSAEELSASFRRLVGVPPLSAGLSLWAGAACA
jgi:hypothetical protein